MSLSSTGRKSQSEPVEVWTALVCIFIAFRFDQPLRSILVGIGVALLVETVWVQFLVQRAWRLSREHKTREAYAAFHLTLKMLPPWRQDERLRTMVGLATSAFKAGQLQDTVRWAERAIEYSKRLSTPARPTSAPPKAFATRTVLVRVAHSMAGVGYSSMNQLQPAEKCHRQALEIARSQKDVAQEADCLGVLADILHKQGRLREAVAAAERALTLNKNSRNASVALMETLRDMGRFDEARQAVARSLQIRKNGIAEYENYQHALSYLALAFIELAAEQADAGMSALQTARTTLVDDKMQSWIDGLESIFLAQQGLIEPSRRLACSNELTLTEFEGDPQTQRVILTNLARAALVRGEWDECRRFYERYFQLEPLPMALAFAFYRLGDCARGEGKLAEAKHFYEKVVAYGFETYALARSQQRLKELSS